MNDKPETKIGYISPLKRICMTIGELPTSYLETMSYYEMLVWFVNYLRDNIIPAVNNNAAAVEELQQLYIELQNYVNDYFDNLDVQDEINNKLDAMVEDGTMNTIINQEIFGELNTKLNFTWNQLNYRKFIFIGDSYLQGYTPDGYVSGWGVYVAQYLGLSPNQYSSHIQSASGSGFVNGSTTFQGIMEHIPDDPTITDVVVCGGYNDRNASVEALTTAIGNFKTSMLNKFPNAKLSIGCIGWSNDPAKMYTNSNMVRKYIDATELNGAIYLKNVEYALHEYFKVWASDGYHPNEYGDKRLGKAIAEALISGSATVYRQMSEYIQTFISFAEDFNTTTSTNFTLMGINNNIAYLNTEQFSIRCPDGISLGISWIEVGDFIEGFIIGSSYNFIDFSVPCILQDSTNDKFYSRELSFRIKNKKLYMRLSSISSYETPQNAYETLSVKNIEVKGFTLMIPSIMA